MEQKIVDYYRGELEYLREAGKEFAEAHPDEARRLGLPGLGADPHVERLLEGFAFLTARIRAKLEDELPELTDTLLGVLYPHYTRPWPAMAIARIDAQAEQAANLRNGPEVPAGTVLQSRTRESDVPCRFRTAYPVRIWPIAVDAPRINHQLSAGETAGGARSSFVLPLRCLGDAQFGQFDQGFDSLRLFLSGDGRAPFALRERLLHDLIRIEIRPASDRPELVPIVFRQPLGRNLRPVGFGADEGLIPFPERSFPGYRNLQEYFGFPQKFLFLDLAGLGRLRDWPQAGGAEVHFYLRTPPDADVKPSVDSVLLHCTPVVNLFEQDCQPIRLDGTRIEHPLVPDTHGVCEVYSISRVASGNEEFWPFFYLHRGAPPRGAGPYWYTRRTPSLPRGSKRTQVSLTFVDASMRSTAGSPRIVSVRAICTDLDRPARLPSGGLERITSSPGGAIRRVTPFAPVWPPPTGRDAQWRLLSHLCLNHLPFGDPDGSDRPGAGGEAIRELLRIHAPGYTDADRMQVEGIGRVESMPDYAHVGRRGVVGGVRTVVDFEEGHYASGPLLLAEVLEQFLAHYVSLNSFSMLVARVGGREVKRWIPRAGDKLLL